MNRNQPVEEQDVQLTNDKKIMSKYSNPKSANSGKPVNQGKKKEIIHCCDTFPACNKAKFLHSTHILFADFGPVFQLTDNWD